jgi:tyrosyl-tRNA synthetase
VKQVLAFETTRLVHGKQAALKAYQAAASMFGTRVVPAEIMPASTIPREAASFDDTSVPYSHIPMEQLKAGIASFKLFHMVGLAGSGGAARRLIEQGGAYINGRRIESFDQLITDDDLSEMEIVLRVGKKRYHKIIIAD